jgi:hypothetical protein
LDEGETVTVANGRHVKLTGRDEALRAFKGTFHWTALEKTVGCDRQTS